MYSSPFLRFPETVKQIAKEITMNPITCSIVAAYVLISLVSGCGHRDEPYVSTSITFKNDSDEELIKAVIYLDGMEFSSGLLVVGATQTSMVLGRVGHVTELKAFCTIRADGTVWQTTYLASEQLKRHIEVIDTLEVAFLGQEFVLRAYKSIPEEHTEELLFEESMEATSSS